MKRTRRPGPPVRMPSGFTGFRFPPEVILLAVRWYLRCGLSYRDLEELLAERGIEVDHVTLYRWVQRFTPSLIDAARPARHLAGDRWFVDETYVKVSRVLRLPGGRPAWPGHRRVRVTASGHRVCAHVLHRRPDSSRRPRRGDHRPGTRFGGRDRGLVPAAWHSTGQYENNRVECDHGRLKARLRPMRGLKTERTASVVIRGHAFVQDLRRGHYELAVDTATRVFRLVTAFDELIPAI